MLILNKTRVKYLNIKTVINSSFKCSTKNEDFFGIKDVTSLDVMGTKVNENFDKEKFINKFDFLKNPNRKDNEEKLIVSNFGNLRYDHLNKPKYHGQYEEDNEKLTFNQDSVIDILEDLKNLDNKIDDSSTNFLKKNSNENKKNEFFVKNKNLKVKVKIDTSKVDLNNFSEIKNIYKDSKLDSQNLASFCRNTFLHTQKWSEWIENDKVLINSPLAQQSITKKQHVKLVIRNKKIDQDFDENVSEVLNDENLYTPLKSLEEISKEIPKTVEFEKKTFEVDENIFKIKNEVQKETPKKKIKALDYIEKLKNSEIDPKNKILKSLMDKDKDDITFKKEKMEYDSKGFKNYKKQTLNLKKLSTVDLVLYLESNIFFDDNGIIAINKPYDLICPGDKEGKNSIKFSTFIDDLAKLLSEKDKKLNKENTYEDFEKPKLYPIYKLDQECTGVYILAKNKETATSLHNLFKENKVDLYYNVITKNVPELSYGSIDIPLEQNFKDDHKRMILRPILDKNLQEYIKPSKKADKAITNYRILKKSKNAAYLEVSPKTFCRHQIRAHLGFGLRTPILGDDLYDSPERVTYQKLSYNMLLNLKVRPTKTRYIPLHLHCQKIILQNFGKENKNFYLKADLPEFFNENLKSLKLN